MAHTCRTPRLTRSSTSKPVKHTNVQKTSTKKKQRGRPKSSPTGKDYSPPVEKKGKNFKHCSMCLGFFVGKATISKEEP